MREPYSGEAETTDEYAMELHPDANPHSVAEKHGHTYVGPIGTLPNMHLFKKKPETILGATHPHHDSNDEVKWSERQVRKLRQKRGFPDMPSIQDPLYGEQWHLHENANVNARTAWMMGYTGEGVNIAVVDDGIQYDHPDLKNNYRAEYSYDFNYNDNNPYPDAGTDDHGTSAAGVAAAGMNTACGLGAAYKAGLSALRLISVSSTDASEAAALHYKMESNHIYTNSWGPTDDGRRKEGPGTLASMTLVDGINNGRGGKGSIYCWAGGNGRSARDNCNYDGWANSRYTIAIGAITSNGKQASYSESCSMLLATAPSSGDGKSITTTDLMGTRGTNRGDCTSSFGGTSAAAPLAAGVMALVLEANKELSWRDMQQVLIESSKKVDVNDPDWFENGAGKSYNHKYGFGILDAGAAVRLALNYTLLPKQELNETKHSDDRTVVQPGETQTSKIVIDREFVIEHTRAKVWASVGKRGEMAISLVSPSGTTSILAEQHHDTGNNYSGWDFGSIANWGESSKGTYSLVVKNFGSFPLELSTWVLTVYGHK